MVKFLRKHLIAIFLILISLVVYHIWFFNFKVLASGDWVFFYDKTLTSLRFYYFSLWLGDSFGRILFDVGQAPTWAMYGILARYLGMNYALAERVIHFWPAAIFTPFFSFLFLKKLFTSKMAIFIGVLVYSFNTYFLVLQTGILTLMVAFAFAPLIILMFMNTLNTLKLKFALVTGLLLGITGAYEPRALYVIVWVIFIYLLYYLLFLKTDKQKIISLLIYSAIPIIITFLLNFYWIIGLTKLSISGFDIPLGRQLFGNEFLNILYAMTLFHPFWTGGNLAIFNVQQIPLIFWAIPISAILGIFLNRKNKNIIFFAIISLIGIFLTKQAASPFSYVYGFLYNFLPGFNAFREASKFYFLIALGYSVLIGAFVDWVCSSFVNNKIKIILKYCILIVLISIFLWNTKPLITGDIGTLFVTRSIPNDYVIAEKFLINKDGYFRTMWFPTNSKWTFYTNEKPAISSMDAIYRQWANLDKAENLDKGVITQGSHVIDFMNKNNSKNLLDISSIKYVFVPIEDKANDGNPFVYYGESRKFYINQLDKIKYLQKIDIGTKELAVYENLGSKPHIYITKKLETISKTQKYKSVDSLFINPTEYKIIVKNVNEPFYLNFSESFNPGWKLYLGDFKWYKVLLNKQDSITDKNHIQNDATLNSYFIDPRLVCNTNLCKVNKDGTFDIYMTLYFAPQSYMNFGLIISISAIIIILCFLLVTLGRQFYDKR